MSSRTAALGWLNPVVVTLGGVFILAAVVFFRVESANAHAFVALLFNVVMVIIAIVAIAMTIPKDDPKETRD